MSHTALKGGQVGVRNILVRVDGVEVMAINSVPVLKTGSTRVSTKSVLSVQPLLVVEEVFAAGRHLDVVHVLS